MFLSQLLVNMGSHPDKPRPGAEWIKQTYRVHQRIWMAFPDEHRLKEDPFFLGTWSTGSAAKPRREEAGFLYRIEPDPPARILVQSTTKPNWEYAFQNAPHLLTTAPQVREFDPGVEAGCDYRFRLVMLMVKRRSPRPGDSGPGKEVESPIRCLLPPKAAGERSEFDPNLTAWRERLVWAAERNGFAVDAGAKTLRVQPVRNLRMKKTGAGEPPSFNAALFEGQLQCVDADKLRAAVVNGVGRGKAFGMGLLSLATLAQRPNYGSHPIAP